MKKIICLLLSISIVGCQETIETKCNNAYQSYKRASQAQTRYYKEKNEDGFKAAGAEMDYQSGILADCKIYGR
jgi:hypothetical protein